MNTQSMDLDKRVRRLERLVRMLAVAIVVLAGLLLLATLPVTRAPDLVQARRVQLVDDAGRVRMDLRHDSTETGVFILDEAGDTRIGVAQFAHGGGGVALHGPEMKGAAVLYLKGGGTLSVYDSSGTLTARFPSEGQ